MKQDMLHKHSSCSFYVHEPIVLDQICRCTPTRKKNFKFNSDILAEGYRSRPRVLKTHKDGHNVKVNLKRKQSGWTLTFRIKIINQGGYNNLLSGSVNRKRIFKFAGVDAKYFRADSAGMFMFSYHINLQKLSYSRDLKTRRRLMNLPLTSHSRR